MRERVASKEMPHLLAGVEHHADEGDLAQWRPQRVQVRAELAAIEGRGDDRSAGCGTGHIRAIVRKIRLRHEPDGGLPLEEFEHSRAVSQKAYPLDRHRRSLLPEYGYRRVRLRCRRGCRGALRWGCRESTARRPSAQWYRRRAVPSRSPARRGPVSPPRRRQTVPRRRNRRR